MVRSFSSLAERGATNRFVYCLQIFAGIVDKVRLRIGNYYTLDIVYIVQRQERFPIEIEWGRQGSPDT